MFDEDWFDRDFFGPSMDRPLAPAVDIEEKEGNYVLRADLPGMKKEDIHIELHDGCLTLRGERRTEHEEEKEGYHRYERSYGTFERSFRVPETVTDKDIHASYHDGVLELTVPAPKAQRPKAIEVPIE